MKYEILGKPFCVVEIELEQGESMISDSGAMAWMDSSMKMETISNGGFGAALGRAFSGETLFLNRYTAEKPGKIAFNASFPGEIRKIDLTPGASIIVQKSAFLCSQEGVKRETYLQRKMATGFFGGEGFIMSKFSGTGALFLEIDGAPVEYDLEAGQSIVVDTGYLAAMSSTCTMEITSVKGMKNKLLGGEGFFNTVITGPGHVILQTMPLSQLAGTLSIGAGN